MSEFRCSGSYVLFMHTFCQFHVSGAILSRLKRAFLVNYHIVTRLCEQISISVENLLPEEGQQTYMERQIEANYYHHQPPVRAVRGRIIFLEERVDTLSHVEHDPCILANQFKKIRQKS